MKSTFAAIVGGLRQAYAEGRAILLLFDYDGTLTPIVDHPTRAALPPVTRRNLEELARLPSVRVGILSGRSLGDLENRVGLKGLDYAGTAGLEWDIDGQRCVHPGAIVALPLMHQAAEELGPIVERFPGAWIERKLLAFSVHHRAIPGRDVLDFERQVRQTLGTHGGRLRVVHAAAAFEVLPQLDWNKGSIVRLIHGGLTPEAGLLYAGDSEGDVEAMKAAAELGGVTVGVGREAPRSSHPLPDPVALSALLGALLDGLRKCSRCG